MTLNDIRNKYLIERQAACTGLVGFMSHKEVSNNTCAQITDSYKAIKLATDKICKLNEFEQEIK